LHGFLDEAQPVVGDAGVVIPDRDGRGDIGLANEIGAELLKGDVGVKRLDGGVGVHQDRRFVGHHLFQDRHD
jgi:hypothetical protein